MPHKMCRRFRPTVHADGPVRRTRPTAQADGAGERTRPTDQADGACRRTRPTDQADGVGRTYLDQPLVHVGPDRAHHVLEREIVGVGVVRTLHVVAHVQQVGRVAEVLRHRDRLLEVEHLKAVR